jgi:hypothetical protein
MFREALEPLVRSGEQTEAEADANAAYLLTLFMGLRVLGRSGPNPDTAAQVAAIGLASVFA